MHNKQGYCLAILFILSQFQFLLSKLPAQLPEKSESSVRVDSIGDPLPPHALMRFGTKRFQHPSSVAEIALSPDERTIVSVGESHLIAWDVSTGAEKWRATVPHFPSAAYGVHVLAFDDLGVLYTPSDPGILTKWDVETGASTQVILDSTVQEFMDSKSVDVVADGSKIAVGGAEGLVVCDAGGKSLFEIRNNPAMPLGFQGSDRLTFGGDYCSGLFSPDGRLLAVVASDSPQELQIWNVDEQREIRRIAASERIVRFAFAPNGTEIAVTERDISTRKYSVETGKRLWENVIEPNTTAECYTCGLCYSPDGQSIAICTPIGNHYDMRLYSAESGNETGRFIGSKWKPWSVVFTRDGKTLYSSGWEGTIRLWEVEQQKQLDLPVGVRGSAVAVASPVGNYAAYVDDKDIIHVAQLTNGTDARKLKLPGTQYSQLAFSPNGQLLAGGGTEGENVHVAVWEVETGELLQRWSWPKGRDPHSHVESLSFGPEGKQLAAAVFRQSKAYLLNVETGKQVAALPHLQVYGLSMSPRGDVLATAGWDKVIRLWSTKDGSLLKEHTVTSELNAADVRMYTVCFSPSGSSLSTLHMDGSVRIWNSSDFTKQQQFATLRGFGYGAMAYSPIGDLLATGSADGNIDVWDIISGEKVWSAKAHDSYVYTATFGADNATLVSGGDDLVGYVWNLRPDDMEPEEFVAEELWKDLSGNASSAYRAMWTLHDHPEQSVPLLRERLSKVQTVIDLPEVLADLPEEEVERRTRLTQMLVEKDDSTEYAVTIRRAVSLLQQIDSAEARKLLTTLAKSNPPNAISPLAQQALDQIRLREGQRP
ncbi:MAG: WD40 repeat domain-containing protein [Planctomycetaceae bacterium]